MALMVVAPAGSITGDEERKKMRVIKRERKEKRERREGNVGWELGKESWKAKKNELNRANAVSKRASCRGTRTWVSVCEHLYERVHYKCLCASINTYITHVS